MQVRIEILKPDKEHPHPTREDVLSGGPQHIVLKLRKDGDTQHRKFILLGADPHHEEDSPDVFRLSLMTSEPDDAEFIGDMAVSNVKYNVETQTGEILVD